MKLAKTGFAAAATLALAIPASAPAAGPIADPLSFFEGRTETISTVKIVMKKPFKSHSVGRGKLLADHSLDLVQRVEEEGQPVHERRWKIRRVGPGRFAGTMSDAVGPVTIDETPKGYRFRFKLKDNMSVEQWLTPNAGGKSARSRVTVKRFGIAVFKSDGIVRKIS